jgi:5-methylthioadenosine/S-adenosylhomocysteine deaminase
MVSDAVSLLELLRDGFETKPYVAGFSLGGTIGIQAAARRPTVYAGTLWGALQALDAGITTIADWAHNLQSAAHADADLRGLQESGIRGYFLYGGPGPASDDPNPPHPVDARRMRDQQFPAGSKWEAPDGHGATRAVLHHSGT